MNVTKEDIKNIKPGAIEPFLCEDADKMHSGVSQISQIKRSKMPDGVVDYESQKFFGKNILLIHAMREGDKKVLNL